MILKGKPVNKIDKGGNLIDRLGDCLYYLNRKKDNAEDVASTENLFLAIKKLLGAIRKLFNL